MQPARRPSLHVVAIALGAAQLFTLELLAGRLVLPVFGGSPGVWTTALCFFTGILFLAYGYAHVLATRRTPRAGGAIHLALIAIAIVLTALAPTDSAALRHPGLPVVVDVILALTAVAGPMAFVLAATSPLLSAWFSRTGRDPWWLYAASNAASLLALLAYPTLIQPTIPISTQRFLLLVGLALYGALTMAIVWRTDRAIATQEPAADPSVGSRAGGGPITTRRRFGWLLSAAVPAGLLSAVTAYLTTDLISAPLLWVGPLAIYLASFVVAFSNRGRRALPAIDRFVPAAVTLLWIPYAFQTGAWPIVALIVVLFASYGVIAIAIHGRLAIDRPADRHLTTFYLTLSAGGLLATTFVAVVAPTIFSDIYEYPILVVGAAVALAMGRSWSTGLARGMTRVARWRRTALDAAIRIAPFAAVAALLLFEIAQIRPLSPTLIRLVAIGAIVVIVAAHPRILAAATALAIPVVMLSSGSEPLLRERNFFGVLEVRQSLLGAANLVYSGTTLHGAQMQAAFQNEPTTYYSRYGPLADVFDALDARTSEATIGVVGLGAGATAAYARATDSITFFEIDDAIVRLASDPRYFTFLRDAATPPRIVLGDARLSIAAEPAGGYDLLVLDAFSSDAVPAHLLTREAMAVYLHALKPDGLLAFHLSNRYYDLGPPVAATLASAGWATLEKAHEPDGEEEIVVQASYWVVAAATAGAADGTVNLDPFPVDGWGPIPPGGPVLTDDFSDLFRVLRSTRPTP